METNILAVACPECISYPRKYGLCSDLNTIFTKYYLGDIAQCQERENVS